MKRRSTALLLLSALLLALMLSGCGDEEEETPPFVAVVNTVQSPGSTQYAAALEAGVSAWCEANGYEYRVYTPAGSGTGSLTAYMEQAYQDGALAIVTAGSSAEEAVHAQQTTHKYCPYLLLDGEPHDADYNYETNTNTCCVLFREEQAGFLAGYAAVLQGYRRLGVLGGVELTGVLQYQYGFLQGADYAAGLLGLESGAVTCRLACTGSFSDQDSAQQLASRWYAGGTQLIFSACGDGVEGVLSAAQSAGTAVICTDFTSDSDRVLVTAEKRFSAAISLALTALRGNDWEWPEDYAGVTLELGAAEDAVGLAVSEESWPFTGFSYADYTRLAQSVAGGSIAVSDSISGLPELQVVEVTEE